MYDQGDDNMKKALGEAMLKSRQDQALGKSAMDDDYPRPGGLGDDL